MDAKTEADKRKIFEAIFNYYEENKNTFAKIYQLEYQMDYANVKARNYESIYNLIYLEITFLQVFMKL